MYLLTIAMAAVAAATRQGSCGLRIMPTKSPVSNAPSGKSHSPSRQRRITTSRAIAVTTAATTTGATRATPSPSAAGTSSTTSATMTSPLGVRKNRRSDGSHVPSLTAATLATRHTSRFASLESRCDDHSFDPVALEKLESALGPHHERGGAESVGDHRDRRDDRHARDALRRASGVRVHDVMLVRLRRRHALVIARCAYGGVRHAQGVEQNGLVARVLNAHGPRFAVGVMAREKQIAAG